MQGLDHRAEMLSRLGREWDAQAAQGGEAARERINRLLDRDSPFLELAPLAGAPVVVGIGVVEATACVVASAGATPVERDEPKVRRAAAVASGCALPLVVLDDLAGDGGVVARHRQQVRWTHAGTRRPPPPPAAPAPARDPEDLLAVPEPHEILHHIVDGSRIDELAGASGSGAVRGWATIGGLPVAVATGGAAAPAHPDGPPAVVVTSAAAHGAVPDVAVTVAGARCSFTFRWPGAEPAATLDHDGVIDPRDTRIAVSIARWCLEAR